MRRVAAGLGSLAIAAGLTTTFALSAGAAAPPDGAKVQPGQNVADELPNPAEEKRRELREVAIRKVLAAAIRAGGSSISDYRDAEGRPGWFQIRHRAYDREGQPCHRCRARIRRILVAGRSSHFCPRCQRAPRGS